MSEPISLHDLNIDKDIEEYQNKQSKKSKFKSPVESILTTDFMAKLHEEGERERQRLRRIWEENGSKGRPPSKLSANHVAIVLKAHTRVIQLQSNKTDSSPPVYVYMADEGIYTSNRATINRYMRAIEHQMVKRDQNEAYYFLQDTTEIAERTNDRHKIPVKNGIFNLKTKQLEEFTPNEVFTTKVNTNYIADPVHPSFKDGWHVDNWLMEVSDNDEEVYNLLWQVIADSINGNYSRKRSIWLVGEGANGKGTYQDLIRHLVGTVNAASLKIDQFGGNSSGQNFNLAMLEGKTVNIGDDVQSGVYVDDSSNFNSVVTGDPVIVEHKGQMGYVVEFNMTIIQSTNGLPRIKNKTHGTYRRFLIVPFLKQFDGDTANYDIKEKYIKDEKVLEYVLQKAVHIDFEEFDIPVISNEMLEQFKVSNDPVLEFYNEEFKPVMSELQLDRIPRQTAHDMFNLYSRQRNYKPMGYNNFITQFDKLTKNDYIVAQRKWLQKDKGALRYHILHPEETHPQVGQNLQSYVKK